MSWMYHPGRRGRSSQPPPRPVGAAVSLHRLSLLEFRPRRGRGMKCWFREQWSVWRNVSAFEQRPHGYKAPSAYSAAASDQSTPRPIGAAVSLYRLSLSDFRPRRGRGMKSWCCDKKNDTSSPVNRGKPICFFHRPLPRPLRGRDHWGIATGQDTGAPMGRTGGRDWTAVLKQILFPALKTLFTRDVLMSYPGRRGL